MTLITGRPKLNVVSNLVKGTPWISLIQIRVWRMNLLQSRGKHQLPSWEVCIVCLMIEGIGGQHLLSCGEERVLVEYLPATVW